MLVIRDLGELVVEGPDGEPRDVGGGKPRTILAVLCACAGKPVTAAELITDVWGPDAPERTQRALESQIWRLRKALSPQGQRSVILTERVGYRLDLSGVVVDSVSFEAEAVALLRVSRTTAVDDVSRTLSRWRGEPFTTAASTPLLDQARTRLHAVRTELNRRRADLLLDAGDLDRALDEAQALIARDPLDEHAWTVKIRALAATGQRAEALTAYRDIRELLATELGVEPGAEVRAAQRSVLDDHSRAVRRVRLPSQHTSFVGRESELADLITLLESQRAVTISGIPGVGKTRLAIEAARRAADGFDDGVWFIPRRHDTDVPTAILEAMRIQPSAQSTAAIDRVCEHLSVQSTLIVLDGRGEINAAGAGGVGSADIEAILRRCAAVTVLSVGMPIGVDGEHVMTVQPLSVETPPGASSSPARRLLIDRIRSATGQFDATPDDSDDLDRICRAMGGLPRGLELAAARAVTFPIHEVADQFGSSVPEPVSRAFALAFDSMDSDLVERFLRLSVLGNPFTSAMADAVCHSASIADDLGEFVRRSLVWPIRGNRYRATRFTISPAVAAHVQSAAPGQVPGAVAARDAAIIELLARTPLRSTPQSARTLARVDDDHAAVMLFLESVVDDPGRLDETIDLIERLGTYWFLRRRLADGIRILRIASRTASQGGCRPRTTALVALALGAALAFSQLTDEAHRHLTSFSLDELDAILLDGIGTPDAARTADTITLVDADPEAHCTRLALVALAAWVGDDHAVAADYAQRAAGMDGVATFGVHAAVTAAQALCEVIAGRFDEAFDHAHAALALGTERGDHLAGHLAAVMLGIGSLVTGDPAMGLRWNDQAFTSYIEAGGVQICDTVEQRGNHLTASGYTERAGRAFAVSRRYAVDAGLDWPRNPFTHESLRTCRETDPTMFDRGWRSGWAEAGDALAIYDHQRFSGL